MCCKTERIIKFVNALYVNDTFIHISSTVPGSPEEVRIVEMGWSVEIDVSKLTTVNVIRQND